MAILSQGCKPNNFVSHNSLIRSFTNIQGLLLNFVQCEFFFESNSPDILALCETNLDDSVDSGNFPVISGNIHGLAVYVKERLPFALNLVCVFNWFHFIHCLTFFPNHLLMCLSLETLTSIIRTG